MWKASAGVQLNVKNQNDDDDDWETDPDFINDVSEQEQRWGSATIAGSGRTAGAIDMEKLRRETAEADSLKKKKELSEGPNPSFGYGGKFGIEKDRMDQSAVGHDYTPKLEKHVSQKDYSVGFGGKFGIQTDRIDKSAVNWDHKEKIEKHASQKDYSTGFGGKFGVQTDRQDKSAVGWDHWEKVDKHESQKDYSKGFGGKFGVQSDRQDKSAVGWDHHEAPQKHESQTDHKIGFGGMFGVQTDRMDKSAVAFNDEPVSVNITKIKPDIGGAKPSDIRAKFERMSSSENTTAVPQKGVQSKVANFAKSEEQKATFKKVDTSFLNQSSEPDIVKETPGKLNISKLSHFNKTEEERVSIPKANVGPDISTNQQEIIKHQPETVANEPEVARNEEEQSITEDANSQEDEIIDTGLTAVAMYDYEAAADDEISFDPDDIITHIEMIDEGWWRGMCKGKYGLFPANYVQLQQ